MIKKTRILYFMPDPPTRKDHGNRVRVNQLLAYFQSRSDLIEVDYMAVKEWSEWNDQDTKAFKSNFPDIGLVVANKKIPKNNKLRYLFHYKIPNMLRSLSKKYRKNLIQDYTTIQIQRDFNSQLKQKKYDIIIISYVIWARLIDNNPNLAGVKLINDTHDFMTAQYKDKKGFLLGKTFEKEIELLSLFHEIWSLSADEQYLFSQFVRAKHQFVPIMYEDNGGCIDVSPGLEYKYDIVYVGSDNDNNQKSISWFFDYVYPLLPDNITICVIGLISNHCPSFPNVEKHVFIDDLSPYYLNSKISICPMLEGTGIKVKVVEALSYALPIVCSVRGLDGLPVKSENGCLKGNTPEEFANHIKELHSNSDYYQHISNLSRKTFLTYFEKENVYRHIDNIFNIPFAKHTDPAISEKKLSLTA